MLWPATEPRLRAKPFRSLEELDRAVAERAVELSLKAADEALGIISLTNNAEELLWSHYAQSHTGIAIDFDETHPFFRSARPVSYSNDPLFVTSNAGWVRLGGMRWNTEDVLNGKPGAIPIDLFFRKRSGWAVEQEYRLVRPLSEATSSAPGLCSAGYPVHLIQIPDEAVLELVFGYRAADEAIGKTITKIGKSGRWPSLKVYRRRRTRTGTIVDEQLR